MITAALILFNLIGSMRCVTGGSDQTVITKTRQRSFLPDKVFHELNHPRSKSKGGGVVQESVREVGARTVATCLEGARRKELPRSASLCIELAV